MGVAERLTYLILFLVFICTISSSVDALTVGVNRLNVSHKHLTYQHKLLVAKHRSLKKCDRKYRIRQNTRKYYDI